MRDLQLSLNQTQRVRLQVALQQLQDLASQAAAYSSVTIADTILVNNEDGILKGHGTSELDGQVVATLCGVVERVNKLVYVRALRARYKPEVGDIIVGRVIEIAFKRWRLEINFSQDAVLMLSSMNLPDGIQRRRTAVDELNMRSIFEENDVICLERGQLLTVPAYLVKRRKQHFHHLEQYGVDLILGCNGFVWVGEHLKTGEHDMLDDQEKRPEISKSNKIDEEEQERTFTPLEVRQHICGIANAVRLLSALGFILTVEAIKDTTEAGVSSNIEIKDMLGPEFYVQIVEREVQRRISLLRKKG
ncbi:exosome complex component RRP4 homolog isoform X2 [Phoenix dactylifera]|uniref:Exosome complex component RRP4 homolog isoform X2 n=1 Tax=Phoenix dactylifera TaxID=42345 RepID=A0A8B9AHK8_PHODC|nr:exosome complex component RRP4 homolog isoform X2 [Phoenix dactylifera]